MNKSFFERFPGKTKRGEMPKANRLFQVFGPGIIVLATALGSGEAYFWPGITMKYGFILIWPALIALFVQYILNTEFARYTVLTGETVVTGFIRLWKPLGYLFLFGATLPWIWPGWSMGAATAFSWLIDVKPEVIAVSSLLIIGLLLSFSSKAYKTLEAVEKLLIAIAVIILLFLGVVLIEKESVLDLGRELIKVSPRIPADLDIKTLLAALAFCGAGGTINLATSNYMQEKRVGMASSLNVKRNRFSGKDYISEKTGYTFEPTERNLQNWKAWWRTIRLEQFVTFFMIGLIGLIVLMLLSHSLVFGGDHSMGMDFIYAEGQEIQNRMGSLFQKLFYITIALIFFTSALGVLDHVSRVSSDIIKTYLGKLRNQDLFSEDIIYLLLLWIVIGFGIIVLLVLNIDQPPRLLSIAGSLSGVIMFVYSTVLLILGLKLERIHKASYKEDKRRNPFRVSLFRRIIIVVGILMYGGLTITLVFSIF